MRNCINEREEKSPDEIRTRVTGFKVQGANLPQEREPGRSSKSNSKSHAPLHYRSIVVTTSLFYFLAIPTFGSIVQCKIVTLRKRRCRVSGGDGGRRQGRRQLRFITIVQQRYDDSHATCIHALSPKTLRGKMDRPAPCFLIRCPLRATARNTLHGVASRLAQQFSGGR